MMNSFRAACLPVAVRSSSDEQGRLPTQTAVCWWPARSCTATTCHGKERMVGKNTEQDKGELGKLINVPICITCQCFYGGRVDDNSFVSTQDKARDRDGGRPSELSTCCMVVADMRRSQQMPSAASVSSRNVALGACSAAAVGVSRTATVRQRSATAWSSAPNWS